MNRKEYRVWISEGNGGIIDHHDLVNMSNQKILSSEEFVPLINYHKERATEVLADWADFALSCSREVAEASPGQKTGQHIK